MRKIQFKIFIILSSILFIISLSKVTYAAFIKNTSTNGSITTIKLDAILLKGTEFNSKIKNLANGNTITKIERADTLLISLTDENIVSTGDIKIYAWYDSGVIYYYSEEETIYLNEDSSSLLNGLTNLTSADLKTLDSSKVTNISNIFNNCDNLTEIDLSSLDLSKVTSSSNVFSNSLRKIVTPKKLSNEIILPTNFYDEEGNSYLKLDSNTPKNATLINGYKVTFNGNGGKGSETFKIVYKSEKIGELPTAKRNCYEFNGWSVDLEGTSYINSETIIDRDITYYAIWIYDTTTHRITYNANGGKFSNNATTNTITQSCLETKYSHTDNIGDDGVPYYHTYNFSNGSESYYDYYRSNQATNDVISFENASSLYVDLTYATERNEAYLHVFDKEYSGEVKAIMNQGQIMTLNGIRNYKIESIHVGEDYLEPTNSDRFLVNSNTVTFSFYAAPGGVLRSYGYYAKVTPMPSSYKVPTYTNRTFDGWYTDKDCTDGNEVNFDNITEDMTLYAKWVYAITYVNSYEIYSRYLDGGAYDGTYYYQVHKIKPGNNLASTSFPETTSFEYEGKWFMGWGRSLNSSTFISSSYVPTSNMKLYGVWGYNVNFNALGGTVSPENRLVIPGNSIGELPNPLRDNYTFEGWFDSYEGSSYQNGSGNQIYSTTIPISSTTYYARWLKDTVWAEDVSYNGGYSSYTVQGILDTINSIIGGSSYKDGYYFGTSDYINDIIYSENYNDLISKNKNIFIKVYNNVKYLCIYNEDTDTEPQCFSDKKYNDSKNNLKNYFGNENCNDYGETISCYKDDINISIDKNTNYVNGNTSNQSCSFYNNDKGATYGGGFNCYSNN